MTSGDEWRNNRTRAMFEAIQKNIKPGIQVVELDCNINDEAFSEKAVEMLMGLMGRQ